MIAGLFGLGGPEILVLLVLGGGCFAVVVGTVVLVVFLTRGKTTRPREDDD
ncbi:MAG TPA: hypothetical protein VGG61_00015 [Gemmataceae bacterium]